MVRFESKIEFKKYCESCKAKYMSNSGEGCPICNTRAKKQEEKEKTTKKGSGKSE